MARAKTLRIVVGTSGVFEEGWIATDIDYLNLLKLSDWSRLFTPGQIDAILAEHVWEHLTPEEGARAAGNCYEFLRTGGYLRLAVPDGLHPAPSYQEWVRVGGSGPGADDHKVLYTHSSMAAMLRGAGFRPEALEYFDEEGRFHENPWEPAAGKINRSRRFDGRNKDGNLAYTSLIFDAWKDPQGSTSAK